MSDWRSETWGEWVSPTFITPQPEYESFSLQGQPKISAPIMECLHDGRSGVSRSGPSDGRPGRWKDIEEVSKTLR